FEYVLLADWGFIHGKPRDEGAVREAMDYRDDKGRRRGKGLLYSFAGTQRSFDRRLQAVAGGYLVNEMVCEVCEGRFYPGVFHNLILPRMEVRWDSLDFSVALATKSFVWKLYDR